MGTEQATVSGCEEQPRPDILGFLYQLNQDLNPLSQTNRTVERMFDDLLGNDNIPESVKFRHGDAERPDFCQAVRGRLLKKMESFKIAGVDVSLIQPKVEELSFNEQVDALYGRLVQHLKSFGTGETIHIPMTLLEAVNPVIRRGENILRDKLFAAVVKKIANDYRFVFLPLTDISFDNQII